MPAQWKGAGWPLRRPATPAAMCLGAIVAVAFAAALVLPGCFPPPTSGMVLKDSLVLAFRHLLAALRATPNLGRPSSLLAQKSEAV